MLGQRVFYILTRDGMFLKMGCIEMSGTVQTLQEIPAFQALIEYSEAGIGG